MTTRRHLMKLIGMSPVMANSAVAGLTEVLSSPSAIAASALVGQGMTNGPMAVPAGTNGLISKVLLREVQTLISGVESENYSSVKIGGLDPDLAALKSVSYIYRANKQRQRDLEMSMLLQSAQRFLWGQGNKMDHSKVVVVGIEEAITESQRILSKWIAEAEDSQEAASASLLKAINPEWCRWLKTSGTKSNDIIHAVVNLSAALICEVIGNVANTEDQERLAEILGEYTKEKIKYGAKNMDKAESLPGFRRTDA